MSLFFSNIIQSIRDKYSSFQGDFHVVMLIIVGVSLCHHIVTVSNNTSYSLKCVYCQHSVDHGDSAHHGDSADYGDSADHGHSADHADSADHGGNDYRRDSGYHGKTVLHGKTA